MSGGERPREDAVASVMLELGRELHLELTEAELCDRFLCALAGLFPERLLAVRVVDLRTGEDARCYVLGGVLRPDIARERVTIKDSAA